MKRKRRYEIISREGDSDLESQYGNKNIRQYKGGGVIAPNNPPLLICMNINCLLTNNRKTRDNLKKVVSFHPKMAPLLI